MYEIAQRDTHREQRQPSEHAARGTRHAARFWVVVPCYNEERRITDTLDALAAQTDRDYTLLIVDNGSTDRTIAVVEAFFSAHPQPHQVIREAQKGTGAASDTGFRHAIAHGARWIARTDADCLPAPDWVARLRHHFEVDGLEFVAGHIKPRDDESPTRFDRALIALLVNLAHPLGRLRRRGLGFKYPYFMAAGNNLAISASLYDRCGGFPRTAIDDKHEDRVLSERVRRLTDRARFVRGLVVYNSTRRLKRYGYWRTLRWYLFHGGRPLEVDVR